MRGDVVTTDAGEEVVLVDIGLVELLDDDHVRVWDVSLEPGATHPWHLHHNPYVVLSLEGSDGRMDWLDGTPPRFISEYRGGAVYRPTSPVHRLTNTGQRFYRNRLVELKALGEKLPSPLDIGASARSDDPGRAGAPLAVGQEVVIHHPHIVVWTVTLDAGEERDLSLSDRRHVLVALDPPDLADDPTGGVAAHAGGPITLHNTSSDLQSWFVVELTYIDDLETILNGVNA